MKLGGWRFALIPVSLGLVLWIFYDHFVGEATALVAGGLNLMPSRQPRTLSSVIRETLFCAIGFTIVRELVWKR